MFTGKSELILVVDDDPVVTRGMKFTLEKNNYRVIVAENGNTAIEMYKQFPEIGLVITDVVLPDKSGDVVGHILRSMDAGVKILTISGFSPVFGIGPKHFLPKPFNGQELLQYVHGMLNE